MEALYNKVTTPRQEVREGDPSTLTNCHRTRAGGRRQGRESTIRIFFGRRPLTRPPADGYPLPRERENTRFPLKEKWRVVSVKWRDPRQEHWRSGSNSSRAVSSNRLGCLFRCDMAVPTPRSRWRAYALRETGCEERPSGSTARPSPGLLPRPPSPPEQPARGNQKQIPRCARNDSVKILARYEEPRG